MKWMTLLIAILPLTGPEVPYDPGVCAQCAIDEMECEDDCSAARSVGMMACAMGHTPGTPGYWACEAAVDLEYSICMVCCESVARACLGRNNCPVVANE